MSFSTDLGGICLGRGDTVACFREGGTTPSHKEVLYISASSGASSKANSLSTILGMPSGPGAFVQRYCNGTLAFCLAQKKRTSCLEGRRKKLSKMASLVISSNHANASITFKIIKGTN